MKSFQNKVAVITGAGSGLGREFALQLAAAGANLALCDLDMAGLEETRRLTGKGQKSVTIHRVNVADQAEMESFAAEVLSHHGVVEILINNAGISLTPQTFEETSDAQFRLVVDVNLWGVYHGIRAFLPALIAQPEASILSISSLAGLVGLYNYSAYSLTKTAVRGLSESLSSELAGTGVTVTVAHPGGVKTNLIRNAPDLAEDERENSHQLFTKFAVLGADKAVAKMLRAVQRKRNRVIVGPDARLVYGMTKVFPRSYPKIIRAVFSQANFK